MKRAVEIGISIYILGFIIVGVSSNFFHSDTTELIICSILYLSAIVGISTSLILHELRRNKDYLYNSKENHNEKNIFN